MNINDFYRMDVDRFYYFTMYKKPFSIGSLVVSDPTMECGSRRPVFAKIIKKSSNGYYTIQLIRKSEVESEFNTNNDKSNKGETVIIVQPEEHYLTDDVMVGQLYENKNTKRRYIYTNREIYKVWYPFDSQSIYIDYLTSSYEGPR